MYACVCVVCVCTCVYWSTFPYLNENIQEELLGKQKGLFSLWEFTIQDGVIP